MYLKWERRDHSFIDEFHCLFDPTDPGIPIARISRYEGYVPVGGDGATHRYVGTFLIWQTGYQPDLDEIKREVEALIEQKCEELIDAMAIKLTGV